ncbi:MAG: condensation domain-containing protein, partial [Pseudomonadota bacterium]
MPGVGVPYPLTRSQQLIWTGQQLQPGEPLYNMALSFAFRGPLDLPAFQRAFERLVQHADALRITFDERDGVPRQRVNETVEHQLDVVDLSTAGDPDDALDTWQRARAQIQFDPAVCLFDACVVLLGPDRWSWYFNQHHLTTDAWSTSVLYRHLSALYAAELEGRMDELEALPSFLTYVEKEQAAHGKPGAERAQKYWSERLRTPAAPSSFYRPVPAQRSGRTRRVPCPFGAERTARLDTLTADAPFRAFTADLSRVQAFATVYFAWLHRLSGERHLAIGTPTHNRSAATARRTPGMFIEVFPLKVSVDDDETFVSLYEKVAKATRELLVNGTSGSASHEHQRAFDVVLNSITARYGDFAGLPVTSTWVHADHGDRNHF